MCLGDNLICPCLGKFLIGIPVKEVVAKCESYVSFTFDDGWPKVFVSATDDKFRSGT